MASNEAVNDLLNSENFTLTLCGNCEYYKATRCNNIKSMNYGFTKSGINTCEDYKRKIQIETVNHPNHYNIGKIEAIDFIEDWGLNFSLGNAIKYIVRAPYKGNQVEDLEKAIWYLNRELERVKQHNTTEE